MISSNQIKADAPVVCSENVQLAYVDRMEGKDTIKLKKDSLGQHHFIPLSWVKSVDDKVHIDRPGVQAMKEWSTDPRTQDGNRLDAKKDQKLGAKTDEKPSYQAL